MINGFFHSELEQFKNNYSEQPIEKIQDTRGLAIAWVSYYFKELVSDENISEIKKYVNSLMYKEGYNTVGWSRLPALLVAAFILDNNTSLRDNLLETISCGQSLDRLYIIRSAAILCPLLNFNNEILRKGTEFNIKHSHGWFEENTVFYLCSKGEREQKKEWLQKMKMRYSKYHSEFFETLFKSGKYYKNSFFLETFNTAKSYFLFKILGEPTKAIYQPQMFSPEKLTFNSLIEKEKAHPLSDGYIDLSFLN